MKNKPSDLNDHLFAQLERLSDESLQGEALKAELARAQGMASVAKNIIGNMQTVISAERLKIDMPVNQNLPKMLEQQ